MTAAIERIHPTQAHAHLQADSRALLVCAYDSAEKFQQHHLQGAMSLDEFASQADEIPTEREIIFYCA